MRRRGGQRSAATLPPSVGPPLRVVLKHDGLDIGLGDAERVSLRDGMIGPPDDAGHGRHAHASYPPKPPTSPNSRKSLNRTAFRDPWSRWDDYRTPDGGEHRPAAAAVPAPRGSCRPDAGCSRACRSPTLVGGPERPDAPVCRVLEDVVAALHAMDEPPVALQRGNERERLDPTRSPAHESTVTDTK